MIQLASTLRNLGRVDESVELLRGEQERASDELDDAVAAFLALALVDAGREREATGIALEALAAHLPRYNRSLASYAPRVARAAGGGRRLGQGLLHVTPEERGELARSPARKVQSVPTEPRVAAE